MWCNPTNENIGLQFLASGLSISHEIRRISCEIHPKPYKSKCFKQNYSVWWMQERGYEPGFYEILVHSSLPAPPPPPNWRVFVETSDFIRFWVDFTWNPPDFKIWAFAWWPSIALSFERPKIVALCNFKMFLLCFQGFVFVPHPHLNWRKKWQSLCFWHSLRF